MASARGRPSSKANLQLPELKKTMTIELMIELYLEMSRKKKQVKTKESEVSTLRNKAHLIMKEREEQLPMRKPIELKELVEKEEKILEEETKILEKRKQCLTQAANVIRNGIQYNAIFDQKLLEAYDKYNADRQTLQEYENKLSLRQHKMCRQLLHIFPFRRNQQTSDNSQLYIKNYEIRNMALSSRVETLMEIANSGGQEEEKMSICLGYVAHLCTLLSRYLKLPLRHPIICRGSRSLIVDAFLEAETYASMRENRSNKWNPEYPLFSKSVDRGRFKHGLALLREDISQLCTRCKVKDYQHDAFTQNIRSVLYSMALAS